MKDKILEIANLLKHDYITEDEAKKHLLNLFGCNYEMFKVGDYITDSVFSAKLESKPIIKADIQWTHNKQYEHNVDISKFIMIE